MSVITALTTSGLLVGCGTYAMIKKSYPPKPMPSAAAPEGFVTVGQFGGGANTILKMQEALKNKKNLRPIYYVPTGSPYSDPITHRYAISRSTPGNPPAHAYIYAERHPRDGSSDLHSEPAIDLNGNLLFTPHNTTNPHTALSVKFQENNQVLLSNPHLVTVDNDSSFSGACKRMWNSLTIDSAKKNTNQ